MSANLHVVDRADRLDGRAILDMLETPAWSLFEQKIEGMIATSTRRLETCDTEELVGIQAEMRVLRRVLRLPDTILSEVQARCR